MDLELTWEQMENLEYRRGRLTDKARRLELLLSGRGESFLPAVRTKDGRLSEERVWELIDRLLEALGQYDAYLRRKGEGRPGDMPLTNLSRRMPEKRETFYRSYLYCAIRAAESDPWWTMGMRGTFDDILTLAERTQCRTRTELHFFELYHRQELDGFFACMDDLYEAFTGRAVTDLIGEEDRQAVRTQYRSEIGDMEAAQAEWGSSMEALGVTQEEADRAAYAAMSGEERRRAAEEHRQELQWEREKQAWIEAFPGKETFCRQYLLCRELYFETAPGGPARAVERMMDVYLYEREASSFLRDDTFFTAYAMLDKAAARLRQLVDGE